MEISVRVCMNVIFLAEVWRMYLEEGGGERGDVNRVLPYRIAAWFVPCKCLASPD